MSVKFDGPKNALLHRFGQRFLLASSGLGLRPQCQTLAAGSLTDALRPRRQFDIAVRDSYFRWSVEIRGKEALRTRCPKRPFPVMLRFASRRRVPHLWSFATISIAIELSTSSRPDDLCLPSARVHFQVHDNRHPYPSSLDVCLYRSKYPEGQYETAFDFAEGVYARKGVETIVDVWCEPEVFMQGTWKELADGKWEGVQHWFVIGAYFYSFRLQFSSDSPGVHPYVLRLWSCCLSITCIQTRSKIVYPYRQIQYSYCAVASFLCRSRWDWVGLPLHAVAARCSTTGIRPAATDSRGLWYPNNSAYTGGGRRYGENHERRSYPKSTEYVLLSSDTASTDYIRDHRSTFTASPTQPHLASALLEYFPNLHIGVTGVVCPAMQRNSHRRAPQANVGHG